MNARGPQPLIFDPGKKSHAGRIKKLRRTSAVVDDYRAELAELHLSRHPRLKMAPRFAEKLSSRWIYLPWNRHLIHVLGPKKFFELRTARNRNLITKIEQHKFRQCKIGIAGLSVGHSAALGLVLEGAENLRLADFDTLALSNLNRIPAGIANLGENKAFIAAQQIFGINPYARLVLLPEGLKNNFKKFISGLDVIVDEMDDVIMKIKLRLEAKKQKIPVISAADNGDNSIVNVERFDLEPDRPIYHGELGKIDLEKIKNYDFSKRLDLINKMVGYKYATKKMKASLALVGKKIYSWPQLGGAAMLSGSAVTYAVRRIALDAPLKSGRYHVSLDKIFGNQN